MKKLILALCLIASTFAHAGLFSARAVLQQLPAITTGNAAGLSAIPLLPGSLTPGSFVFTYTQAGPNIVHIDLSTMTSWSGSLQLVQVSNGVARVLPLTTFRNDVTLDFLGISSGATGAWSGTVYGAGRIFLVAASGFAGPLTPYFDAGAAGSGPGNVSVANFPTTQQANQGTPGASAWLSNGATSFGSLGGTTAGQSATTTITALTTYLTTTLGTGQVMLKIVNTGSADVYFGTSATSSYPTDVVPAGSSGYLPYKSTVTLYFWTAVGTSTIFCTQVGY